MPLRPLVFNFMLPRGKRPGFSGNGFLIPQRFKFCLKFMGLHDEGSMRFGRLNDLQIRRNHGAIPTILPGQTLDDLIGAFSPLGKHHLHARPVFMMLKTRWLSNTTVTDIGCTTKAG